MANLDRIERFSKIKTWLGPTFEQRPSPHTILNQMLTDEQTLILRLTNKNQPWALISKTLTTVAGTSEYTISQPVSTYQNSGKVHYVIRTTDDEQLPYISVPYDDFSELDYGQMPEASDVNDNLVVPEKIAFYRLNAQDSVQKVVIQPTPQSVLTYTIWYFVASVNRSQAAMTSVGPMSELNDYLDLKSAAALLPSCEWSEDREVNNDERKTRGAGFAYQLGDIDKKGSLEYVVEKYIRNINAPKTMELDNWND